MHFCDFLHFCDCSASRSFHQHKAIILKHNLCCTAVEGRDTVWDGAFLELHYTNLLINDMIYGLDSSRNNRI